MNLEIGEHYWWGEHKHVVVIVDTKINSDGYCLVDVLMPAFRIHQDDYHNVLANPSTLTVITNSELLSLRLQGKLEPR